MSGKRNLPANGSKELERLKKDFTKASRAQMHIWAKKYGFRNVKSFYNSVYNNLGLKRDLSKKEPVSLEDNLENEKLIVNLPPINFIKFDPPKVNSDDTKALGTEEIALLVMSDGHAGKITKSFNKEVYRDRMETAFKSSMRIINHHRLMYPINKLKILILGDNVQGENPFQGSKIGEVEMGARDQVKYIASPIWNDVIGSFKQHFEDIEIDGYPGNHGHDKLSSETSSYDLLFYDILEAGIGKYGGIKVTSHESFGDIININGFRFFCFHGDGVPCQQGVPYFALDKKLKSWYMQFGGFDYAMCGHFHKRHTDEVGSKVEYFMCGSLVSDDEWALKKLGISSNPSQWIMGVHPRKGITWRYPLIVDYKFLPKGELG